MEWIGFGFDLDLIWIEIGVFKNFKECARSPCNGNHFLGKRSEPHTGVFNRDFTSYIYVHVSVVCQINCVRGITWIKHPHAQSQYWAVKSDQ